MMSNRLLNITIIVLGIVLFSCAGESKDQNADIAFAPTETNKSVADDVLLVLEEEPLELSIAQKEAFQTRAIQKFSDFTDYMNIISDPNIEEDLIEHSLDLVGELFVNDSITKNSTDLIWYYAIQNAPSGDSLNREPIIKQWPPIHINIKSIKFINDLSRDSSNVYIGTMKSSFIINGKKKTNNIDVHLVEVEKSFGDSNQTITEVRLGKMY